MKSDLVDSVIIGKDTVADLSTLLPTVGSGNRAMYRHDADCRALDFRS